MGGVVFGVWVELVGCRGQTDGIINYQHIRADFTDNWNIVYPPRQHADECAPLRGHKYQRARAFACDVISYSTAHADVFVLIRSLRIGEDSASAVRCAVERLCAVDS